MRDGRRADDVATSELRLVTPVICAVDWAQEGVAALPFGSMGRLRCWIESHSHLLLDEPPGPAAIRIPAVKDTAASCWISHLRGRIKKAILLSADEQSGPDRERTACGARGYPF